MMPCFASDAYIFTKRSWSLVVMWSEWVSNKAVVVPVGPPRRRSLPTSVMPMLVIQRSSSTTLDHVTFSGAATSLSHPLSVSLLSYGVTHHLNSPHGQVSVGAAGKAQTEHFGRCKVAPCCRFAESETEDTVRAVRVVRHLRVREIGIPILNRTPVVIVGMHEGLESVPDQRRRLTEHGLCGLYNKIPQRDPRTGV